MAKAGGKIWTILLKILSTLVMLAVLAFLYVTLIVAQPREENQAEKTPQPLLQAGEALVTENENDLLKLVSAFPAPVMSFMSGSGMVFVSGTSSDIAFRDGFGRLITLYWQTPEGQPLILQSFYPADPELMGKGDYIFSDTAGPVLFGLPSVRMENRDTLRIHALTDQGLYALTIPRDLSPALSNISRSIQLFTAEAEK